MHCKLTYNFIFSKSEKLRFLIDIILLIFWPLMDHETAKRERGKTEDQTRTQATALWPCGM